MDRVGVEAITLALFKGSSISNYCNSHAQCSSRAVVDMVLSRCFGFPSFLMKRCPEVSRELSIVVRG